MSKKFFSFLPLLFLIIFSFLTRFYNLGFPPKVLFDEAHHTFFAESYLVGRYFFDTHPPLGKMLFALAGYLAGNKSSFNCDFQFFLGTEYEKLNFKYLALRSVTALCGSLFVIVIYFLVREMGFSKRVAFLSSFLILFDNAFLVQSRVILLDILMIFFIFLSLYFFFAMRKSKPFSKKWYFLNFLTGSAMGCAFSIKWPALGVLLIVWLVNVIADSFFSKSLKEKLLKIFFLFILPFLLYSLFFFIHFSLLKFTCPISHYEIIIQRYYPTTTASSNFTDIVRKPPEGNFIKKLFLTNYYMLLVAASENYFFARSPWWSWPLMIRPVPYFYERIGEKLAMIYFLGNPVVWGLGILGTFGILALLIRSFIKSRGTEHNNVLSENLPVLLTSYVIFFFFFSGVRSVPVYYYLPALAFSLITFSIFAEQLSQIIFNNEEIKVNIMFLIISILVLAGFFSTLPLTYGFPIFK